MMKKRYLSGFLILALLGACATAPRVDVARDPDADFARYATFSFHTPLGTDRQDGTGTILSRSLRQASRAELEALGYRYTEQGGDLEVNFFVETREVVEGMNRPRVGVGIGVGGYHNRYGVWTGYGTDSIRQFTEGTLHVDVVDAARRQLVWEGIARDRLREGDYTFELDDVQTAVTQIFARFPPAAAPLD
jgi:hypothetical protein